MRETANKKRKRRLNVRVTIREISTIVKQQKRIALEINVYRMNSVYIQSFIVYFQFTLFYFSLLRALPAHCCYRFLCSSLMFVSIKIQFFLCLLFVIILMIACVKLIERK